MGTIQLFSNESQDKKLSGRLWRTIEITKDQASLLSRLVKERSKIRHWSLCMIDKVHSLKSGNGFCQSTLKIRMQYEPLDLILSQIKLSFPLPADQVQNIIFCICKSLLFLEQHNRHHGDINTNMIGKFKNKWKLIDNCFINKGISSYEKVMEGEVGFISPKQMHFLRYGFLRQSPPINFADEVFALGMTCLQVMSGKPSQLCYSQSFRSYNQRHMHKMLNDLRTVYPQEIFRIVALMLIFNEGQRITIGQIISEPCIKRHSKPASSRR